MSKKISRIFGVALAMVLLLSACADTTVNGRDGYSDEAAAASNPVPSGKTALTMAVVYNPDFIHASYIAQEFNNQSDKYKIVIKDYSDGGTYDLETAKMKLNVDIGSCPDLIGFTALSPYVFVSHGYLMDLLPYIDADEDLSRDDISILKALTKEGGLYFISDQFTFTTGCGKYSTFGDRHGWSLDEYLEIENSRSSEAETIYNITHESFLDYIVSRYVADSIDWSNGVCDLNNGTFISLLEAAAQIKESPEPTDPSLMDFTYDSVRVAQGTLVMGLSYCTNPAKLAYDEYMAGERLSFIGWPTVDGSNGSDINLQSPVGICTYTENPDGCWEFIKYMLIDHSDGYDSISVYKPALLDVIEYAKKEKISQFSNGSVLMTDEDAERFLELLADTEHLAINDEAVMSIVTEEAMAYFDGKQTVERTAELIQSRVQLYVSEQS